MKMQSGKCSEWIKEFEEAESDDQIRAIIRGADSESLKMIAESGPDQLLNLFRDRLMQVFDESKPFAKGRIWLTQNLPHLAKPEFEKSIKEGVELAECYNYLANINLMERDFSSAEKHFKLALENGQDTALLALIAVYCKIGRQDKLVKACESLLEKDKDAQKKLMILAKHGLTSREPGISMEILVFLGRKGNSEANMFLTGAYSKLSQMGES